MNVMIIATRGCSHCAGLKKELNEIGVDCAIKYAEEHPELVEKYQIRHSPNLVVDDNVVFRRQPSEAELKELFHV